MPIFKLSATLQGHEDDVRALCSPDPDTLVSGSRDSTVRVWRRIDPRRWSEPTINYKSAKFVNSLACYKHAGETFIVSGGNDALVNLTLVDATFDWVDPAYVLVGHQNNVCALACKDGLIMSGSWDSTAKVWRKDGTVVYELKGHENSVWGVQLVSATQFVTCGADRTIRVWNGATQVRQWVAHTDVVRDVLVLPDGTLASCSNDTTVKLWTLDGDLLQTLHGHQNFVYSLAVLPTGELVSSGEDRTIRVWDRAGTCVQTITLPCISVWKVIALENGDIAAASSDAQVRIFTRVGKRVAARELLDKFEADLQNSTVNDSVYNVNKDTLPGRDSLKQPGTGEGETRMVRTEIGTVEVYQWNESKWSKVGEVVNSTSTDKKKEFNGQFYDYVFDVDIADGQPPLKLPYNTNESPYAVADKFLLDNNLPASYSQQVVDFILANTGGASLDQQSGPGSSEPYQDPAYQKQGILPQTEYLQFSKLDETKIRTGFAKLNAKQAVQNQIEPVEFETCMNCQDFKQLAILAGQMISNWDASSKLLGFDILRFTILHTPPFETLFELIKIGLTSQSPKVVMMTIRLLVNIFSAKQWGERVFADPDLMDVIFLDDILDALKIEKLMSITVATFVLNYAVFIRKLRDQTLYTKLAAVINKFGVALARDEESAYRLLVAIGTLKPLGTKIDAAVTAELQKYKSPRFDALWTEIK
ncbi:hypothetical protein KL921_001696 [Ogataea angusta]|uniref:Uncharacterized protein n=1 Tax=Pichia angusta TaxID=870730 RepID=A0AAN6I654_PICAN|nr:uncharacterized protein KL928_002930 [Ogataea angusta]KAG7812464.1 hypothetical protein KL921_001696 [Ogataea angusta]KAG7819062.1 hypothetical protein KL928_002930 [Ogataea angusta]KAG7834372.1 hypothetical protein KL943_002756 [Ogataea angusta]KAG7841400.1 hypothetical protein KL942_001279 [Ogataea angusta]KAG7847883.1 hypothetical protein KL941_002062 [Ogataea angusta]